MAMVKGLGVLTEVQVTEVNITETRYEKIDFQIHLGLRKYKNSPITPPPPQNFSDLH